jgi:hypothetical protein
MAPGGIVKTVASALSFACAFLCASAINALAEEDASVRTAQRLLVRSGLSVQLRGLPQQMETDVREVGALLDPNLTAALLSAVRMAFQPELLESDIAARVAKNLTIGDMTSALSWVDSAAGKRITLAEERGSTEFDPQLFTQYVEALRAKPLAEKRGQMLTSVVAATNGAETVLATQEAIAAGVAVGMDSLQPRGRRQSEAALRMRVRQSVRSETARSAIMQQLPLVYAYFYRNITDADLAAYVQFLESRAGKRYQQGMTAAFVEGLARASLQVGELAGQYQRRTAM